MDVAVDAAWRDDHPLAGDDFRRGADHDVNAGLNVGIAGLADAADTAVLDADVGLDDAPVIDDQRVGDDSIGAVFPVALTLPHPVADHLAAAEFHFLAVDGEIFFDPDDKIGVGEAYPVAERGPEHFGISLPADFEAHIAPFLREPVFFVLALSSRPMIWPVKP